MAARLTSSQLYDLYRRLDVNGDGCLDIEEFYDIAQRLNFLDYRGNKKKEKDNVVKDSNKNENSKQTSNSSKENNNNTNNTKNIDTEEEEKTASNILQEQLLSQEG